MRSPVLTAISMYILPAAILLILGAGLVRRVKIFEAFTEGAAEGISTVVRILPSLVGIITAIGVFRASGALDAVVGLLAPAFRLLGIPAEAIPLVLMRPVSGSASLAIVSDIIRNYGPDSYAGRVACTMLGSTETVFYTLAVYYGSVGIRNIRYTLAAALIADAVSAVASAFICALIFGR
ncbi:MAG TPA: nucleoside recognition domain-containing protein [Clostridiales bacterium]|nr:nucleoside recognition domain-containing protein [Clostridiales bacterium]HPV02800.1 nucleoside recognition domain-containing protein [Clostridiales bacterium]